MLFITHSFKVQKCPKHARFYQQLSINTQGALLRYYRRFSLTFHGFAAGCGYAGKWYRCITGCKLGGKYRCCADETGAVSFFRSTRLPSPAAGALHRRACWVYYIFILVSSVSLIFRSLFACCFAQFRVRVRVRVRVIIIAVLFIFLTHVTHATLCAAIITGWSAWLALPRRRAGHSHRLSFP